MTNIHVHLKNGISYGCYAILSSRDTPITIPSITIISSGFSELIHISEIKSIELVDDTLCPLCDNRGG